MIWATVSSQFCVCWLHRTSPSLTAKNLVIMCRVISWVAGKGYLLWPVFSLVKTLLTFALLHFVVQGQICLLLQVSLDFLLLHSNPLQWKGHLFWVLFLNGLVGLHRTVQRQLLKHYWLELRLGLLWYWMVCLGNEQRWFCRFWDCILITQVPAKHTLDTSLPPEGQDPAPPTSGLEAVPPTGKPAQLLRPASSTRGQRAETRSHFNV